MKITINGKEVPEHIQVLTFLVVLILLVAVLIISLKVGQSNDGLYVYRLEAGNWTSTCTSIEFTQEMEIVCKQRFGTARIYTDFVDIAVVEPRILLEGE